MDWQDIQDEDFEQKHAENAKKRGFYHPLRWRHRDSENLNVALILTTEIPWPK